MEEKELLYKKPKKIWQTWLYGAVFIVFCFVFLIIIGFNITYVGAPVSGESMQPTLNAIDVKKQDTVYINRYKKYGLGDIIVIQTSKETDDYIIKRVVGMEGDSICIYYDTSLQRYVLERSDSECGQAHIVEEPYIKSAEGMEITYNRLYGINGLISSDQWKGCFSESDGKWYFTVPAGEVFVLGDNRGNSTDSSAVGSFSIDKVLGRVDHVIKYGENKLIYFIKSFLGIK